MDFTLPDGVAELRGRVREFVAAHVIPLEGDPASYDAEHENIRLDLLDGLRARAKAEGLWALQMPRERGGRGLGVVGMAATYEEMGRSIFGPPVFNCAAPDDGNMILLNRVATEAQKDRWLQPIVDGRVRKRGWEAALRDAGLAPGLCIEGDWSPRWAYEAGLRLVRFVAIGTIGLDKRDDLAAKKLFVQAGIRDA